MSKIQNEPLLADNPDRFVMFPLQDQDIWKSYKKMMDCFWRAEEIDFSKDMTHWKTLTEKEQYFIKMILAFFAASDGIVDRKFRCAIHDRSSITRSTCCLWIST